jgi:hypothetical protein
MAEFLLDLCEFDKSRVWSALGYPGLFAYLRQSLGLSAGAASFRKTAVELLHDFPALIEPLRKGQLCLSSLYELKSVITAENWEELVPKFYGRSKREAEQLARSLSPVAAPSRDVFQVVRVRPDELAQPSPSTTTEARPDELGQSNERQSHVSTTCGVRPDELELAPRHQARDEVKPLSGTLNRAHLNMSSRALELLEKAKDLSAHSIPGGSAGDVIEAALELYVAHLEKRKGLVDKPRAEKPPPIAADTYGTRQTPRAVSRGVWKRDQGRCQWPLAKGGICGATRGLHLDHHPIPFARGGPTTVENCRLLCRIHNQQAARETYGDEWMDQFKRNGRQKARAQQQRPPAQGALPESPAPSG